MTLSARGMSEYGRPGMSYEAGTLPLRSSETATFTAAPVRAVGARARTLRRGLLAVVEHGSVRAAAQQRPGRNAAVTDEQVL